jgi:hypothetical protein
VGKEMIGIAHATSPKLNAEGYTDTSAAAITQSRASAFSVSFLMNAGIKYRLNKKLSLILSSDYFSANTIKFKNVTGKVIIAQGVFNSYNILFQDATSLSYSTSRSTVKQPVSSIDVNFGIWLAF